MLLDLFASLSLLTSTLPRTFDLIGPAAIPVWDQYVDFLEWVLDSLASVFNNGGLAIIAFTIIVKTLMLPLTIKSTRSSKAMQELAPRIKEIQKKYGQDRQKASQETFALYNQHGVNPMAGCLPMLIQIPIFFGVYRAIVNLVNSDAWDGVGHFMWLNSLENADSWHVLPIAAGVFQFVQSRMMRPANQKVTDPQQQIMNTMMNFMPLMVVVFGWSFASGAVLYWAVQSVYSVVQQWFITGWGSLAEWFPWLPELPEHRRLGYVAPRPISDVMVVSGDPPEQKGFSGWMNRKMRDAQKTAEERQKVIQEQRAAKAGTSSGKAGSTRANATVTEPGGEVIDVESRPARKGSSYQERVNAASRNRAKPATNGATPPGADPNPNSKASRKRRRINPTT